MTVFRSRPTLERCDGLGCNNFGSWRGHLNLTSAWTWGSFTNLQLDGDNTNLTITSNANGWVQIDGFYSTKGPWSLGRPIWLNAGNVNFRCAIHDMQLVSSSSSAVGLCAQNGTMSVVGAYVWDGLQSSGPMLQVLEPGVLYLSDARLDASGPRTDTYIQTLGAATLSFNDCDFMKAPGAGGVGLDVSAATKLLSVSNVVWSGWGMNAAGSAVTPGDAGANLTLSGRLSVAGTTTLLAGGTFQGTFTGAHTYSGQLTLGAVLIANGGVRINTVSGSPTDLTTQLLWTTTVGIGLSTGRLNYVLPTGLSHVMMTNSVDRLTVSDTAVTSSVPLRPATGALSVTSAKVNYYAGGGLTATGSTRADALQLAFQVNRVTTVAAGTGVILPVPSVAGDIITVYNGGASTLRVYCADPNAIDGLGATVGVPLSAGKAATFTLIGAAWISNQLGIAAA